MIKRNLRVKPITKILDYGSNIDTDELNDILTSLDESVLRAIVSEKDIKSEINKVKDAVIASQTNLGNKINSIQTNQEKGTTTNEDWITLDYTPISKIPRGKNYNTENSNVSEQAEISLDGTPFTDNVSDIYSILDGNKGTFWSKDISDDDEHELEILLPPTLNNNFNYIEINPYPLYSLDIISVIYQDLHGDEQTVYNNETSHYSFDGLKYKIFLKERKKTNGVFKIKYKRKNDKIRIIGFSSIDIANNIYENTKEDELSFNDTTNNTDGEITYTLTKLKVNVFNNKEEPIEIGIFKNDDTVVQNFTEYNNELDLNDNVTLASNKSLKLKYKLKSNNGTTPVIKGAKLEYTQG